MFVKKLEFEDIWHTGHSNTPIYARLIMGEFDGKYLGILINMENKNMSGIKEYDATTNLDIIKIDMRDRANLLASTPRPLPEMQRTVVQDPVTGKVIVTETPVGGKTAEEGGLR